MVQGVGFRFTAERVAVSLDLKGWVKNLPDGRVEVMCEGDEASLALFIGKMNDGPMKGYIRDPDITWLEATGEFSEFYIKIF